LKTNKLKNIAHNKHFLYLVSLLITISIVWVVSYFNILNPAAFFLVVVAFSVFLAGIISGIISGFITITYCGYFFSNPGHLFSFSAENSYRMVIILISVSLMIFMIGTLKNRIERRSRELELRTEELELANKQLFILSSLDGLTGISNRRSFEQIFTQEWQRNLNNVTPISLAIIDIDFFKNYNDTYGHQAGDECLKQVAGAIVGRIQRPGDFVARYGGEEFVVLLSNTNTKGAVKAGEEVRKLIEALKIPHAASEVSPFVTVSVGIVSVIPFNDDNYCDFIKKADLALYNAKRRGRNKIHVYKENDSNL
jgi:diguanylate cyclase (GGDEF)-like protein